MIDVFLELRRVVFDGGKLRKKSGGDWFTRR
jgi:hypothetical protein